MRIVAGIVVVVLLGWLGGTYYVASAEKSAAEARRTQEAAIASLGKKLAGEFGAIESGPLKDACAGKLEPGGAESVVAYSLELPENERPSLRGYETHVDAKFLRMNDRNGYLESIGLDPREPRLAFTSSMSPDDWSRHLEYAATSRSRTEAVKYVVLTSFLSLRAPSVSLMGDTFTAGSGDYRSRVVRWPSGETICQGSGRARMELSKVTGHGGSAGDAASDSERELSDNWVQATLASPLDDVCAAGGKDLCTATANRLTPVDW